MNAGADVTHFSPVASDQTPSIASVCGSIDPSAVCYSTEIRLQPQGVEIIAVRPVSCFVLPQIYFAGDNQGCHMNWEPPPEKQTTASQQTWEGIRESTWRRAAIIWFRL